MPFETLAVRRAAHSVEDPWQPPANAEAVRLVRATDGAAPRLATTVFAWYDEEALSILFAAADDHVVANYTAHDDPLYEEDVVEVFLAPSRLTEYYELEVSPLGILFDARLESPDGVRATMTTDLAWTCEGLVAPVRKVVDAGGAMTLDTLLRIPFASLAVAVPSPGDTWRANFFRIDRHPDGDELTAWQPTLKTPPDFHVAAAFGTLQFE